MKNKLSMWNGWLLLGCCLLPFYIYTQTEAAASQGILLKKIDQPIRIDGLLEEASWFTGRPATDFWENFPSDTTRCPQKTEVYMAYDDNFLYIAAKCFAESNDYIVPSLRRDYRAGGSDNITFLIDPFQDRTNAFVFGMNPYGVMREALISNGGRSTDDWLDEWDNKWKGAAAIQDGFWSCEVAIPFSSIRFPEGKTRWNFNTYRFDTQSNTRSTWQYIPQNQIIMSLGYMGEMEWETPPTYTGMPVSVIPYITGGVEKNHEDGLPEAYRFNVGLDAKIPVTTGLNLDLTANPDFSQVEVDRQVVNLTRFEIFLPERRQFFLENSDLFSTFGSETANPFFSRRIGIATDENDEVFSTPIYYGARLSGKLDNNWRLGLLNMSTANDFENGLPAYNYTVAALQRKVFARSNAGFIMVNKQALEKIGADTIGLYSTYNRVVGLDYNLASSDNKWIGKTWMHRSFSPDATDNATSQGANISYRERRYAFALGQQYVGEGFNAETGFVPRTNFWRLSPDFEWFFYPKKGKINRHGPGINTDFIWTPGLGSSDRTLRLSWRFNFTDNGFLRFSAVDEYIYLLDAFDPTGTDATPLPGQQGYHYRFLSAEYSSDNRQRFTFFVEPTIGQFFNGMRYGAFTSLGYRLQPYGLIALNINYNYIDLPDPFATKGLFLIGPRIDLTFTKSLFLTTFLQYNEQAENFNLNMRMQWRFAPVSDFFLVFTDNYNTLDWQVRNRAVVAKLTYWLNL
ncbi:MAG: DUF5916 domain-containing protein [Saprospiraceae bacterium]